jgi:hypothetical protein
MYYGYDSQGNIVRAGHGEQRMMGDNKSIRLHPFPRGSTGDLLINKSVALVKKTDQKFHIFKIAAIGAFIVYLPDILKFFKEIKNRRV